MWSTKYLVVLCLCGISFAVEQYKLCSYPQDQYKCDQVARGDSLVQCVTVQDSVDCALKIQSGKADFGYFTAEQSQLVYSFLPDNIAVVADVRMKSVGGSNNSFETVVVVPSAHQGGISALKGKKYCRSDVDDNALWTRRVGDEFENAMFQSYGVQFGTCSQDGISSTSDRMSHLANLFGDSCRAGTWTGDSEEDTKLKQTKNNLCKLCTKANCHYTELLGNTITDPNEYALKCLESSGGYFAFTTLSAVTAYFSTFNNNTSNYKLLCRDGSTMDISDRNINSCSWRNQPWPMILSASNKVLALKNDLNTWLPEWIIQPSTGVNANRGFGKMMDWKQELGSLLVPSKEEGLFLHNIPKNIKQQLTQKNQTIIYDDNDKCTLKWCTISDAEQAKCWWLSQASRNQGLYPQLECVQAETTYHCMHKIKNKQADAMMIDSNHGYLARKNNLRNLVYIQEKQTDVSSIIALIKSNSSITSFNDLKNKNACFPEYQGIAWLAFIKAARDLNVFSNSCDYEKLVTDFFTNACAPGARDHVYHRAKNTNANKLCGLCTDFNANAGFCEANYENKYFNNNGSFACLNEVGDVAFIEKETVEWNTVDRSQYNVLCKSGKVISIDQMLRDDDCPLIQTVDSEIIYRGDDQRKQKYVELLNNMDDIFGASQTKPMELFKLFNDTKNLMFKSKSLGFDSSENPSNLFAKNYVALFKHVDMCTGGGAGAIVPSILFIFISLAVRLAQML